MIICEHGFDRADHDNPDYSLCEVDYYAWIPSGMGRNHRLSLRKNLKTGEYEVYRRFFGRVALHADDWVMITGVDMEEEEIVGTRKDLESAINLAEREYQRFHGTLKERERDKVCQHKPPVVSSSCPIYYGRR